MVKALMCLCSMTRVSHFSQLPHKAPPLSHTHTNFQTHLQNSSDLRPVAAVEHCEKEYPVGPLGARKVLCSSVCVLGHVCVCVCV